LKDEDPTINGINLTPTSWVDTP